MQKLEIQNKADIDTALPLISIIGRPNVGKSTLFNRLIGKRRAITDPTPGVTRDPIPERWLLGNHPVTLVDSGGIKIEKDSMDSLVAQKSLSLLDQSDCIIFMMDCSEVTGEDQMLLKTLRPYTDKLVLAVNKIDDVSREDLIWNFYNFGYQRIVGISAEHGLGIEELEDTLLGMLSLERLDEAPQENETVKIAILGKPNTGKSTLTNLLTGRSVSIVSDIAGTTRDVMRGTFTYKGTDYTVLDTAGIRRKSKVEEDVEYYSVNRAIKTIDEADIVFLMVDVKEGLSEQDKKIAALIVRRGKGVIICLNKIDLLKGVGNELEAIKDRVRFLFPVLSFAPIVPVCAWVVWRQLNKRVDTSSLNEHLKAWGEEYQPPRGAVGHYKVLYATQVSVTPVRFLLFVNRIKDFPETYISYLKNCMRKDLGLPYIPVNRIKDFPETYISYLKNCMRKDLGLPYIPIEISLRERRRNPSLNEKGPQKSEIEIDNVIKKSTKQRERAEKIVRNTKQKKKAH